MKQEFIKEQKYLDAKKQVQNIKGVYWHLVTYIVINCFISIAKVIDEMDKGKNFNEAFFEFETFGLWLVWAVALALHAFTIFGKNLFLGKDWEKRKIKQLMKQKNDYS